MWLLSVYKKAAKYGLRNSIKIVWKKIIKILFFSVGKYVCRIDPKKIVFFTFSGNYECNPKWICEELLRENVPVTCVWGLPNKKKLDRSVFPEQVEVLSRNTIRFYWHLATARIIIDNAMDTAFIGYTLKKNQRLIETWHGSLGIKRFDADTNKDKNWVKRAEKEAKMTSYIISNSDFENDVYRNSFWKTTKIWKYGHARNDILINKDIVPYEEIYKNVKERFGIPDHVKICMYAPTFRDDRDLSPYKLDYERLIRALSLKFGGEWIIFSRFHLKVKELLSDYQFPANVYNVSDYPDIQELLCITDVGITDYSSWICEYMLTRKPGFLFATDAFSYEDSDRKFFFPLTDLPFPLAVDENTLIENIEKFDQDDYTAACNQFLEEKGCVDDGHASERIVKTLKKLM